MAAFFRSTVRGFLERDPAQVRDALTLASRNAVSNLLLATVTSWERSIAVLRDTLARLVTSRPEAADWGLLLEYEIPRRDRRVDAVLLAGGLIIVIEFKTGEAGDEGAARRQVEHYALDLRDFHGGSFGKALAPIAVLSKGAPFQRGSVSARTDLVQDVLVANDRTLCEAICSALASNSTDVGGPQIDLAAWDESAYSPIPNIVEAAQMLYAGQNVREISHAHADAHNLTQTAEVLIRAVNAAQAEQRKIICFVTGVPGAGKTLAGLNMVHSPELMRDGKPAGVLLSGNTPLVEIVREALARDHHKRADVPIAQSRREVRTFVQGVHAFLKEYRAPGRLPQDEHVVVWDEAQRGWNLEKVRKKFQERATSAEREQLDGIASEPATMLSIMERRGDWAVVVAIVGGGQEIHDGEAGLAEWGRALRSSFPHWEVWASPEALHGGDGVAGGRLFEDGASDSLSIRIEAGLHLHVAVRSFRAEAVARWVNAVVAGQPEEARGIAADMSAFPIVLTRSVESAREWLRHSARGLRRCGLLASSGAARLRAHGIEVSSQFRKGISLAEWFLAAPDNVRSSNFLEVALTEFECQGLELDWVGVCWGGDFTWSGSGWEFRKFLGSKWSAEKKLVKQEFIRNKYRVLLTRAREGMVIWVPPGADDDATRDPPRLDATAEYLRECGVAALE